MLYHVLGIEKIEGGRAISVTVAKDSMRGERIRQETIRMHVSDLLIWHDKKRETDQWIDELGEEEVKRLLEE